MGRPEGTTAATATAFATGDGHGAFAETGRRLRSAPGGVID